MKKFTALLVLLLFLSIFLHAERECILLTIPKSGSHLILKVIESLTNKKAHTPTEWLDGRYISCQYFYTIGHNITSEWVDNWFQFCRDNNRFPAAHTNFTSPSIDYLNRHPNTKIIFMVRDPKDTYVSWVHFRKEHFVEILGRHSSFKDRLKFVILTDLYRPVHISPTIPLAPLNRFFNEAQPLLNHPSVVIIKFEDLIGANGGGSKTAQKESILKIADALDIYVSEEKITKIQNNIFGNSITFRSGQIGSGAKYFSKKTKAKLNEKIGKVVKKLGYQI